MPRVLFTKETAAEMARRSHAPGSARFLQPVETPQPPQPTPPPAIVPATLAEIPTQDFIGLRLSRVRAQLDRLDALLAATTDTKAIKELADATKRLQDQERELSGRPLPGSRRPAPEPRADNRPATRLPAVPQPAVAAPLPRLDQPLTSSQSGALDQSDEPEGIDYGPID
jgi:hypothetical protein